jgi:hypothetical protein
MNHYRQRAVRDDHDNIVYFPSQVEAKQAAYAVSTL